MLYYYVLLTVIVVLCVAVPDARKLHDNCFLRLTGCAYLRYTVRYVYKNDEIIFQPRILTCPLYIRLLKSRIVFFQSTASVNMANYRFVAGSCNLKCYYNFKHNMYNIFKQYMYNILLRRNITVM